MQILQMFPPVRGRITISVMRTENGKFQEEDLKEPPNQSLQMNDLRNALFQTLQDYLPSLESVFQVDLASK